MTHISRVSQRFFAFSALLLLPCAYAAAWGFKGHALVNRAAVFLLPPELQVFYRPHLQHIEEYATMPDRRRYTVKGEAAKHYIDLDTYKAYYGWDGTPLDWEQAQACFSADSLQAHGTLPWHLHFMCLQLTKAFASRDGERILRLSTEMGHYVADAHVPLHTTRNYNGQFTGQQGVHALWESLCVEQFAQEYRLLGSPARYCPDTRTAAWQAVFASHAALDSVLAAEREASQEVGALYKHAIVQRGGQSQRLYSQDFLQAYHRRLGPQIARRMRQAMQLLANLWYTCWVDAGQPPMDRLHVKEFYIPLPAFSPFEGRLPEIPDHEFR